jgi:hypothetical protein
VAGHASAAGASIAKTSAWTSAAAKIAMTGGVIVALGTGTVMWQRAQSPHAEPRVSEQHAPRATTKPAVPAPTPSAASEEVTAAPPREEPAKAPVEVEARTTAKARTRHTTPSTPSTPSLQEEMAILYRASAALERGDANEARALLTSHARLKSGGQLAPERRGLELVEACMSRRPGAERKARAYLQSAADAVLAARVARACAVDEEPKP